MQGSASGYARFASIGLAAALLFIPAKALAHHGGPEHLPAVQQNLALVGELEPLSPHGPIVPGQIADLAVHEGYAYLNSWDEPTCAKGGTYVVDIGNPANPQEAGFIPAELGYYHGEGAHVISIDTPQFTGDLLAVNDEACSNDANRPPTVDPSSGGFDLYDVTDPENPVTLIQNAGDPDTVPGSANSYHSVFVWQDGTQAYLVASDNTEFEDVDIFNISDPAAPVQVADLDIITDFPQVEDPQAPNGNAIFHHDVVVKEIAGQMRMLVSYWDAGYVQLNVDNPAAPTYITDTDFLAVDPLVPGFSPEGNAHQAEYSFDNQFFVAADEDFAAERLDQLEVTSGPSQGPFVGGSIGGAAPVTALADPPLNGPTAYGGYGCDASAPIPTPAAVGLPALDPGEESIVVLQRGPTNDPSAPEAACFPGEKAQNGVDAGWDAVVLTNRHDGSGIANCGSGGFTSAVVAVCTTHAAMHVIFGQTPSEPSPYPPGHNPAIGALGEDVSAEPEFDGWGYAHLYNATTSAEIDAFAIPESLDPAFASGFGDLSIHEFATDPATNLAYSSYYSGGVRVFQFGAGGLTETGAYIDPDGSNFWGVEQFTPAGGGRLIAGSDRDFGLQIFRYTGPGAVQPPGAGGPPNYGQYGETDPPQTKITKKPKKKTTKRTAKFKFTSDEANSTFQCKLDKKKFKSCDSPYKKKVAVGKHKFRVRAIDPAGNVDPSPATYTWKVIEKK